MIKVAKFFNTAGPIKKDLHYYIEPLSRWDMDEILLMIRQQKYFVLHAPRQTGKTTSLLALMDYLNEEGNYYAVYANVEMAQAARNSVDRGIKAIIGQILGNVENYIGESKLSREISLIYKDKDEYQALHWFLGKLSAELDKPLVLVIDEIDSLVGNTLISVLRQIRTGYLNRPAKFPLSIILCGIRDVRDYRITVEGEEIVTGGSAFNIKAVSLRLGNFSKAEIITLFQQHTAATGQQFDEAIWDYMYELTNGQPWLVNAIGYEVTMNMRPNRDSSVRITKSMIRDAKELLILRRDTHLDQLVDKLKEPRVQRVIEPMLSGKDSATEIPPDDIQYVIDLGLIRRNENKTPDISNAIYKEIIPRELTYSVQYMMDEPQLWYLKDNGQLNIPKLLTAFQSFFRKHSEHWVARFHYKEAGPQLLLQAFLQRIVNGGGTIEREYGLGRRRTDLFVSFPYKEGVQEVAIEMKIRYNSLEKTIEEGIAQTKAYMDKCDAKEGHLIIFDRRENVRWEDKIFYQEIDGIGVWGC